MDRINNFINRFVNKQGSTKNRALTHIGLFFATFITTTIAGTEWTTGIMPPYELSDLLHNGLPYSLSVLFIVTVHEFGHYFAAKYHKVNATLPFYIPFPPIGGFLNFGTMGAVIKTQNGISDNVKMFDIGIAGPIAGFIASIGVLIFGFTHLPGLDYILNIHPDYLSDAYGQSGFSLTFGNVFLYQILEKTFTNSAIFVPPMTEMYHYPYLLAGWFGMLITSMNLMPVGQLDGGHVVYSLFGPKIQEAVASIFLIFLAISGVLGFGDAFLNLNIPFVWSGWLFWALVLYFFIKLKHPPVMSYYRLDIKRRILGYIAILIFILTFIPVPFS